VASFTKVADLIELDQHDEAIAMMRNSFMPNLAATIKDLDLIIALQKSEMQGSGLTIKSEISLSKIYYSVRWQAQC